MDQPSPMKKALILMSIPLVLLPMMAGSGVGEADSDDEFRTVSGSGTATWKLNLLNTGILVPINEESGTLLQDTHRWYDGDNECRCTHTNWLGICDKWEGFGAFHVVWFNEVFRSGDSDLWSSDGWGKPYSVYGISSDTTLGKAKCGASLAADKAAKSGVSSLDAGGFRDVANARTHTTTTRVHFGVPFTGLGLGLAGTEVCSEGTMNWRGSLLHAEFHFSGPARACNGGQALGTLVGDGRTLA